MVEVESDILFPDEACKLELNVALTACIWIVG